MMALHKGLSKLHDTGKKIGATELLLLLVVLMLVVISRAAVFN